jgi:hypothetical protein
MPHPAHAAFREAVLDLSDEPTPMNVLRYLAASRTLTRTAPTRAAKKPARRSRRTSAEKAHA